MKKLTLIIVVLVLAACGKSKDKVVDENTKITTETSDKIKKVQDVNTELEEIDGELDSLLIKTE